MNHPGFPEADDQSLFPCALEDRAQCMAMFARLDEGLKADREARRELREGIQEIRKCLRGNGQPGLITDVDRLKEAAKRQAWWTRAIVGVLLTLGGAGAAKWLNLS